MQSISSFFQQDHVQLDRFLKQFQENKHLDDEKARQHFRAFKNGLERHILWEERILFPIFEEKTGVLEGGPTGVMRMEHQQIKAALEALHEKIRTRDVKTEPQGEQLVTLLGCHNQKEEHILYPMIDHLLSEKEQQEVFLRMERIPDKQACCCDLHE